ncbi:o-succinylbenzoate synthase [Lusitaniella coriacea]|uniref:o-succinylbenzoate synthase n=1 Tax=Lusitaniella coriacea TaxID=1983105 RepID=UPI003CE79F0C
MTAYNLTFQPYRRRFRQPLQTHHGIWEVREGIIVKLVDELGNAGWGEIAPLPWFGSETLEDAIAFCRGLGEKIEANALKSIPSHLPACQFGLECAIPSVASNPNFPKARYSHLLPPGENALQEWESLWQQGGRTFKWKIGIHSLQQEITLFEKLARSLPEGAKIRLDANGGLNLEVAKTWLQGLDSSKKVEFIEQPLPPSELDAMVQLSGDFTTPIALDESVATLQQLEGCYEKGWRGIFIIKPAIAGSPQQLRQFCQQYGIDAVFSSVFETEIGRRAALNLAAELSNPNRAIGFGVNHWFD